jgi:hypothetical protein
MSPSIHNRRKGMRSKTGLIDGGGNGGGVITIGGLHEVDGFEDISGGGGTDGIKI